MKALLLVLILVASQTKAYRMPGLGSSETSQIHVGITRLIEAFRNQFVDNDWRGFGLQYWKPTVELGESFQGRYKLDGAKSILLTARFRIEVTVLNSEIENLLHYIFDKNRPEQIKAVGRDGPI